MKKLERYIIIILIFIAVGAIGTAVYFGVNNKQIKEQNKVDEVNKQESDKKEDLNNENIENDKKEIVEIYPKVSENIFDKTRAYDISLMNVFSHNNFYNKEKVLIKDLPDKSKLQLIINQLELVDECYEEGCFISKSVYDSIYVELFADNPVIINDDNDFYEIKYDNEKSGFNIYMVASGDEGGESSHEFVITQNSSESYIEFITTVSYYNSENNTKICSDKNCEKVVYSNENYNYFLFKKEVIKNQDKFDKYKYTFKYSNEYNTYYFYSVEKVK